LIDCPDHFICSVGIYVVMPKTKRRLIDFWVGVGCCISVGLHLVFETVSGHLLICRSWSIGSVEYIAESISEHGQAFLGINKYTI
jgi:hypothetical protein